MSQRIRILVADDHAVVRSALAAFLSVHDDLCLVGEATDGREAVQLCQQLGPDVVLMDVVMPRMDGATATRLIRAQHPEIQIVALTSFEEVALVQGILTAGAINYLLKTSSGEELAGAIRRAGSRCSRMVVSATHPLRSQRSAPGPHGQATPQAGVKFPSL